MTAAPPAFQVAHQIADKGFGTGTNEHYDKARPSYPPSALRYIHSQVPATEDGLRIIELGSGTGLFSRLLIDPPAQGLPSISLEGKTADEVENKALAGFSGAEPEVVYPRWNIHSLYSVEPSAGMRETWVKSCAAAIDRRGNVTGEIATLGGGFTDLSELKERLNAQGGWADLIVIAQAYHWAHPTYAEAITEMASLLRPSGKLVFIWNTEDRRPPYPQDFRAYEQAHEDGTPQQRLGLWRETFGMREYKQRFEPPVFTYYRWDQVVDDQAMIDRVFSKSYVAYRPAEEKTKIEADLRKFLAAWQGREWIDEAAGKFLIHFSTEVVIMQRKAEA